MLFNISQKLIHWVTCKDIFFLGKYFECNWLLYYWNLVCGGQIVIFILNINNSTQALVNIFWQVLLVILLQYFTKLVLIFVQLCEKVYMCRPLNWFLAFWSRTGVLRLNNVWFVNMVKIFVLIALIHNLRR